jgi:hypothetical protein
VTSPSRPPSARPVDYKGEPLDSERGPGLGCFRFQVGLLVTLIILTPLTVAWGWPVEVSIVLLLLTLILLLFAGQTVIFLLRLVAADRRDGRRVPLASASPTVGELEDSTPAPDPWRPTYRPATPPAEPDPEPEQPGAPEARELAPADDAEPGQPGDPGVRE